MTTEIAIVDGLSVEIRDSAAILTMHNPGRRNAFYPEMRRAIVARLKELALDASVRSVILTGADGHFSAGADLSRVAARERPRTVLETQENMKEVLELLRGLVEGAKPVIAAVEGGAFGAGCSIAMACDIVVATPGSRFGPSFSKLGLVPDLGLLYTLQLRVGLVRARRLMMLSTVVQGEQAVGMGLADELAPEGEALETALGIARQFEAVAPLSVALIKGALAGGINSVADAVNAELNLVPLAARTEDAQEAIAAFIAKRQPVFKGH